MILPDFQNLYTNRAYISREQQVRLFRHLIKILREQITDVQEQQMQLNLHGILFSILAEANFDETVFMAADRVSNQLAALYFEQLRPNSILVTSDMDEATGYGSEEFDGMLLDYLDMLNKEIPKQFTIMIFPFEMLKSNFGIWLKYINTMLAYRGRIILYDCPDRVPVTEEFFLIADYAAGDERTIKMLQTNKLFVPSENNIAVTIRIKKLQRDIEEELDNEMCLEELDRYINEAWVLEKEIIRYHDEFPDEDSKYKINELKNALLDFRYSDKEDMDFFRDALTKEIQNVII